MNISIIKMSNAYDFIGLDGLTDYPTTIVDMSALEGTRCYLDDEAKKVLMEEISKTELNGVHFIDSGNYHYLSLLYLMRIQQKFDLFLVDNHPDMKAPSFGNITSCGGWVLEAIETLPNLRNVYMLGIKPELIEELEPLPDKVRAIKNIDEIVGDVAVYISIDKDALAEEYAITDWDQGNMNLEQLINSIQLLMAKDKIIGIDICGDTSEPTEMSNSINLTTNKTLLECLTEAF